MEETQRAKYGGRGYAELLCPRLATVNNIASYTYKLLRE